MRSFLAGVLLLATVPAWANSGSENASSVARARLYAQLADHNLLQIMLVVPTAAGKSKLTKSPEQGWKLSGDVLCVDLAPLGDEIDMRAMREFPEDARTQTIPAGEFYRAIRFDPPRPGKHDDERDYRADMKAALTRYAAAKLVKKVTVELKQGAGGCTADVLAVPAIRFFKRAGTQPVADSWVQRMERGDVAVLGQLSVAELRVALQQRVGGASGEHAKATPSADAAKRATVHDMIYGALRVDTGRFKPCYVAAEDPLQQLVAWSLADSEKVKRWMRANPQTPKAIADLDSILADFRKPAAQRNCTLLVATTPVLAKVKAQLEREKLPVVVYPETASATQVLAAYGFRTIDELELARAIGIESGEQFAPLRSLGLDTRAGYDQALTRYAWQFGSRKPDAATLAAFVRDEREAATKAMTVRELHAERAKRAQTKSQRAASTSY
jgi:hypothetical protein